MPTIKHHESGKPISEKARKAIAASLERLSNEAARLCELCDGMGDNRTKRLDHSIGCLAAQARSLSDAFWQAGPD